MNNRQQLARQELARRELARRQGQAQQQDSATGPIQQQFPTQRPDRFIPKASQPYDSYSYGDALKDTGKTAINSLANLGEGITQPFRHPIQTAKNLATGISHPIQSVKTVGNYIGDRYGSMEKAANTVSTDPFGYASDVTTGVYGGAGIAKAGVGTAAAITKPVSKMPMILKNFINKSASPIRDYAGNKVTAIRNGAKIYWKNETTAYGNDINSLANDKTPLEGGIVLENMTKQMIDRNLYDRVADKWVKPLDRVDSQLIKSYEQLKRKSSTGKMDVGDIVKEYQTIRDSAPVDTSLGREAKNAANSFIHSLKDQINIPKFQQANLRYADFKNNFDLIDANIDVWGNPLKTGKGEKFLTRRLGESKEARTTGHIIENKTGQSLKAAKAMSTFRNLPAVKLFVR